jgi:hypothetical protein
MKTEQCISLKLEKGSDRNEEAIHALEDTHFAENVQSKNE